MFSSLVSKKREKIKVESPPNQRKKEGSNFGESRGKKGFFFTTVAANKGEKEGKPDLPTF